MAATEQRGSIRGDGHEDVLGEGLADDVGRGVLVGCPECGLPAAIVWRDVVDSTEGPVEHAKITCAARHHFLMPTERLTYL